MLWTWPINCPFFSIKKPFLKRNVSRATISPVDLHSFFVVFSLHFVELYKRFHATKIASEQRIRMKIVSNAYFDLSIKENNKNKLAIQFFRA